MYKIRDVMNCPFNYGDIYPRLLIDSDLPKFEYYRLRKLKYLISLKNVRDIKKKQFQQCKNLNNVPFLCTKLFQKSGHYLRGNIVQGGASFKEIW